MSAEFDLVIRGGVVVDGTGAPRVRGDVAIVGDRIAAVGDVGGRGREEIDADGHVVAPGFVDGHTHFDAQVFWDELGTSSCWHGVTTVVMGNCGFTLAPARADERPLVVRNLERAEDIAAETLAEGVPWGWSTFAEYLDAVDARPKGFNYAGAIGHSALRTWAMGERAFEGAATDDDMRVMEAELADALRAGAVGLSTSRTTAHATSDGRPVASRLASWDEVVALTDVVRRNSTGTLELAPEVMDDSPPDERVEFYQRVAQLALDSGVPAVVGVFASPGWLEAADAIDDAAARGGEMYGLTHCRGVSIIQSFRSQLSFDKLAEWQEVRRRPLDEQQALLRDPQVRARLVHAAHHGSYGPAIGAEARKPNYDQISIMRSTITKNPTVADEARARGVDPVELMIDLALESDFHVMFMQQRMVQDESKLVDFFRNPNMAMTFSDAGAHPSQISDSSIQSYLLAHWVRERQAITLEEAVRMITHQPAKIFRLHDRGVLAPGFAADVTIFDPATVAPTMPRIERDLPGGAHRLVQGAEGFLATVVNGAVFTRDGRASEARTGRLLRAGRIPVPTNPTKGTLT
jgi:N-acyl-D-aspartate/D-glutamate deacylase